MLTFDAFSAEYRRIFNENNLESFCKEETIQMFYDFTNLLIEENSHTNLTAIREIPDIITKHFADCLLPESLFPQNATVLDVGCGGGFPTIPLAIARPDLKITAIDSTQKKINFVQKAVDSLKLSNVTAICARAEATELRKLRESFDVVTSRAMARMSVLIELTLPFAKIGGQVIALKGAQGENELSESMRAIPILGGNNSPKCRKLSLKTDNGDESRTILVVSKVSITPNAYPRNYSVISKKPL
jgi:16S rRNA (guanine527-N7)-methyltransferase